MVLHKVLKLLKWVAILFFGSSVLAVVALRWIPVWVTPLMVIRSVENPECRGWHHEWVPLSEMSPWMPKAVVASEDGRFYDHHGFDFKEINNALEERAKGKRERGASTITQQTAKNVFLWPGHSWVRKGLEAYFTVLIEIFWSKERILEVYLNSIEMGPGIYGAQAAAEQLFGTSAARLTKRQCALIAVSLPNPLKRDASHPTGYMRRRASKIMRWM